jgi:predicted esterase
MTRFRLVVPLAGLTLIWGTGCGSDDDGAGAAGSGAAAGSAGSGIGGSTGGGSGGSSGGGSGGSGGAGAALRCSDAPPAGAALAAPPKAYSGGTCPMLMPGVNTIRSTIDRQFILVTPADLGANERVPVIFLWHWLGGDANDFFERGEVQNAVNAQRFIAVIPEAKDGTPFKWPFSAADTQQALDEELVFFDDMLSCVSAEFAVNENCVATAGVSAGALWSAQLASYRGEYLSSFLSLSGGTGGLIKPWGNPAHKLPAIVLWGGPQDTCIVINFQDTSHDLEQHLTAGGHFFLECVHNCTHNEPPFPAGNTSKYEPLWQFVFDHPFWLAPGQSPYTQGGIPAGMPEWCGIGAGSATIRTGECGGSACAP